MNVKYHSSQDKINQSIVVTASRTINQKEAIAVEADLVETEAVEADLAAVVEVQVDMAEITAVVVDLETEDHEKCIKQPVETVAMNVKYHSNQVEKNQSIVMTASRTINQKEAIADAISHF